MSSSIAIGLANFVINCDLRKLQLYAKPKINTGQKSIGNVAVMSVVQAIAVRNKSTASSWPGTQSPLMMVVQSICVVSK